MPNQRMSIKEASQIMGLPEQALRLLLRNHTPSWGYAFKGNGHWIYYINRFLFEKEFLGK